MGCNTQVKDRNIFNSFFPYRHKKGGKRPKYRKFLNIWLVLSSLVFCLVINQGIFTQSVEEPITSTQTSNGEITVTWNFNSEENFTVSNVRIEDSLAKLQIRTYDWSQGSNIDFNKDGLDNTSLETPIVIWSDNFEYVGQSTWTHGLLKGNQDQWEHGIPSGETAFIGDPGPGQYVWGTNISGKYEDDTSLDCYLMSPPINLSNAVDTELRFWQYYDLENDTDYLDGCVVEVMQEGMVPGEQIFPIIPAYTGYIQDTDNPLSGRLAYAGNSSKWLETTFSLSDYDGSDFIRIIFRFATNGETRDFGWYIDDIEITSKPPNEIRLKEREIDVGKARQIGINTRPIGHTIIDANNPVNFDGILTSWTVNVVKDSGFGKMKIFRKEGNFFKMVAETDMVYLSEGENTLKCNISVQVGDYIGWYGETARIWAYKDADTIHTIAYNQTGDIVNTHLITNWTSEANLTYSIGASGFSVQPEGFYTSEVLDSGSDSIWQNISWIEDISQSGTDIVLQIRTGDSDDPTIGQWRDWSMPYTTSSGSELAQVVPNNRYCQFRAKLTTSNHTNTPVLCEVKISYTQHASQGSVETEDFSPEVVVQWLTFESTEDAQEGLSVEYYYSVDSGITWNDVPETNSLATVSVTTGKIRLKAELFTIDTTVSPTVDVMKITYSAATPLIRLYLEAEKATVHPGDEYSYTIYYENEGIGLAKDVMILFILDNDIVFVEDSSQKPHTIEENTRKWEFGDVQKGNRSFSITVKVKDQENINEDTIITTYAELNYTDLGNRVYESVSSNVVVVSVNIESNQNWLIYIYLTIIAFIIVLAMTTIAYRAGWIGHHKPKVRADDLEKGTGYLIMEDNPEFSYSLFSELLSEGHEGMCITRTFPDKIKEKYGLKSTPILWLSRAQDKNSVLPTNLGAILHNSKDFIRKNKNSVVLLDGLEYLVVHNDFSKVLKLIHGLNEVVALNQALLLIPLNPVTLDADKVALLERDLKLIE